MFKVFGSASVIIAAMLMGIRKYNGFFERKRVLESIRDGSIRIEHIIRCMCAPLDESFMQGGEFYVFAAGKIRQGSSPCEAINESALEYRCLKEEDIHIIGTFAKGLGADDCEGQLSNIKLFINSLELSLSRATDELEKKGKLYIKGSILTAAAVVLFFI